MNLEDKKIQSIVNKLEIDEEFKYIDGRLRWERANRLLYDTIQIYIPYLVISSRKSLGLRKWQFRTDFVKLSIDYFHCLYVAKNMDFEEIIKRYIKQEWK